MDTASFTGGVAFAFQGFRAFSGTGGRFIKILGGVKWLPESLIDPMLVDLPPRGAWKITKQELATLEQ